MQERRRRLDVPKRVQSQVEPVCVADDDSAVLILLGGGRGEAEIGRKEPLAAPFVANRNPRWPRCMTVALLTLTDNYK
jgi:hypothetical protein